MPNKPKRRSKKQRDAEDIRQAEEAVAKDAAAARAAVEAREAADVAEKARETKLVDDYVRVREQWKRWKPGVNPHQAEFNSLQQKILKLCESSPPEEAPLLQGSAHVLPVSQCELRRRVKDRNALFIRLGGDWWRDNCPPTLTDLEKALDKPEQEQYIAAERTGPRTIKEPVLK